MQHGRRARGIVLRRRKLTKTEPSRIAVAETTPAESFDATPENDLVFRGGRILSDLVFKNCYLGHYWTTQAGQSDRTNIDKALAAAMSDAHLNNVVRQYFGNHPITSTSLASVVLPAEPSARVTKSDVRRLAAALFRGGTLAGIDLDKTVVNFMLPPGIELSSDEAGPSARTSASRPAGLPEEENEDSLHGLGGYHGSAHLGGPNNTRIYYSVGAYSAFDPRNGDNGIPIPGWHSWESIVATFYHELNEARTDPDVEDANDSGNIGLVGWTSQQGAEIGDSPIAAAGNDLTRVFRKVPLADGSGVVPVQLLYSNAVHGPQEPTQETLPVAGADTAMVALGNHATVAAATSAPALQRFAAPANLDDLTIEQARQNWSDSISDLFDQAVKRTQDFLQGSPSQFYNPTRVGPAGADTAELPILWQGFPKSVERQFGTGTRKTWQTAEQISGTRVARQQFQDEYLEWFVSRDHTSGKIVRVDFTCEGPEYWSFLAQTDPDKVLALYQQHVSPAVKMTDLFHNNAYDPLNPWNLTRGAMHLIQPSNTLSAEIFIAADATVLRHDAAGNLITDASELIDCAGFGVRTRASDPHIGDEVNGLARQGFAVTLTDPVGLYIKGLDTTGWTKPDGSQLGDYFKIVRGGATHAVRAVYQVPQNETSGGQPFVVGDILIGGSPIEFGGQIAKNITMQLVGSASGKGTIAAHAVACGGPPGMAVAASAAAIGRFGTRQLV
jgi:hypothetical protein